MLIPTLALAAATSIGPFSAESLAPYRWQKRPIVIFAAQEDPRLQGQIDSLTAATPELVERDTIIIVDTNQTSALRARFRPGAFTVILVGLDGGEKLRSDQPLDPDALGALIDTMPMRQHELRMNEP